MSKILVIPDTHIKPKIFDLADKIIKENQIDEIVQLGDNIDDFYALDPDYRDHQARMLIFKHEHPDTIWLWGNHEMSYILNRPVTGNIKAGSKYASLYYETFSPKLVYKKDNVIFSHAGIYQEFLDKYVEELKGESDEDIEKLISEINSSSYEHFWNDFSPLWARPQYTKLTEPHILKNYLQVTGHTPQEDITRVGNNVITDVFSTNWGKKIGSEQLIIVDSETKEIEQIDIDFRKEFLED